MSLPDVVVAGGGAIGLSVAWHLAKAGAGVTVFDSGPDNGQASIASAGMLAPLAEAEEHGPLVSLGLESLSLYPAFSAALKEDAGIDAFPIGPGTLRVALDEAEEKSLGMCFSWQRSKGLPLEWLTGAEARRLEPALSRLARAAVFSPEEKRVAPRALMSALAWACRRRGVRLEAGRVTGFETRGARVTAAKTDGASVPCGQAVIAAGAWSAGLAKNLGVDIPVFPVRGQMISFLRPEPDARHAIYSRTGYVVPREEGRLAAGATQERAGFDCGTTKEAVDELSAAARGLIPSLAGAHVESAWAGLRPGSGDGLPILGPLPGWENAHVASGHFRNGILLTPVTGRIMARLVLERRIEDRFKPFLAQRWGPLAKTA